MDGKQAGTMDKSRRNFFRQFSLRNTVKLIAETQKSFKSGASESDYFDSYENCYPLISEYSYFLEDEVKDLGLDTSGKSHLEIVETVYKKKERTGST